MGITIGTVDYLLTSADAKTPYRKYDSDAGFDLFVSQDVTIEPGCTIDVHTDICISMPLGMGARIVGRSSTLRNKGLIVNEGIIDQGYNGELFVCVHNVSDKPFHVKQGSRLAQILFYEVPAIRWNRVSYIQNQIGTRNGDGFGSTGE